MRRALQVVAVLNADVKGEAANPSFALERAVQRVSEAKLTPR
jgi:DNA polymerase III delta subunit